MLVTLLRHAETAGNLARRYIGRTDEPLCQAGLDRLAAMGQYPGIRRVFVSPLLRARQTASLLFPQAKQIICPDLREMDFGIFEGLTADALSDNPDYLAWVGNDCQTGCPGGEHPKAFRERTCQAFKAVIARARIERTAHVMIVCHGGSIMAILERFGPPVSQGSSLFAWHVAPGQGFQARLQSQPESDELDLSGILAISGHPGDLLNPDRSEEPV